jgi:hypothetical protein
MGISLLEKLYSNKIYEETVDVIGLQVRFRTLSATEEEDVLRLAAQPNASMLEILQGRRIPTLARAIVSIDGTEWKDFDEIQQILRSEPKSTITQAVEKELRGPRYTDEVVSALNLAYGEFRQRYRAQLDAVKKSSNLQNPETVG